LLVGENVERWRKAWQVLLRVLYNKLFSRPTRIVVRSASNLTASLSPSD
jgi:hypothetical protein